MFWHSGLIITLLTEQREIGQVEEKIFHNMNLTKLEFKQAFESAGFVVNSIVPV